MTDKDTLNVSRETKRAYQIRKSMRYAKSLSNERETSRLVEEVLKKAFPEEANAGEGDMDQLKDEFEDMLRRN